jgi:predicted HTH transcriptional regulator
LGRDDYPKRQGLRFGHLLIVNLMTENPAISAKSLAERVGLTSRSVYRAIDTLKKHGVVERVGPAKGGRWVVKLPERRS